MRRVDVGLLMLNNKLIVLDRLCDLIAQTRTFTLMRARDEVQLTEHFSLPELFDLGSSLLKFKLSSFAVTSPSKDDTILLSNISSIVP